jgi:dienelactone hydrolase
MTQSHSRHSEPPWAARESFAFLAAYEKRFLQAARELPLRRPWVPEERAEILSRVRSCLGIRDAWVPSVETKMVSRSEQDDFVVEHLRSRSWPGVAGAADLYLPRGAGRAPLPVVLLACGHSKLGKRGPGYMRLAGHLARQGMAVLVSDNIGQGERKAMGHWDVVDVFACGLSLQGLIVMEAMGWLRRLKTDGRFHPGRVAAIGNSGGGTLTLFLGALGADDLAAVSSSGYPCTFDFIARKEKKHCHCNVLPHIVGELEMWQIYGCIAPRPLLLFQGAQDHFFPADLFRHVSRKVAAAYEYQSAGPRFEAHLLDGEHRWDSERRILLTQFLCRTLGVPFHSDRIREDGEPADFPPCLPEWPAEALTADALARQLTGHRGEPAEHLWEVFRPNPEPPEPTYSSRLDVDLRQIAAQYEAFLKAGRSTDRAS